MNWSLPLTAFERTWRDQFVGFDGSPKCTASAVDSSKTKKLYQSKSNHPQRKDFLVFIKSIALWFSCEEREKIYASVPVCRGNGGAGDSLRGRWMSIVGSKERFVFEIDDRCCYWLKVYHINIDRRRVKMLGIERLVVISGVEDKKCENSFEFGLFLFWFCSYLEVWQEGQKGHQVGRRCRRCEYTSGFIYMTIYSWVVRCWSEGWCGWSWSGVDWLMYRSRKDRLDERNQW